jgi:hypothetical protein
MSMLFLSEELHLPFPLPEEIMICVKVGAILLKGNIIASSGFYLGHIFSPRYG